MIFWLNEKRSITYRNNSIETALHSFSGAELLATKDYSGLDGSAPMLKNINPLIFSQIRITGNLWTGAAGAGYSWSEITESSIKLKDTVTGEIVYSGNLGGRPFNTSISLEGLSNPIDIYIHFAYSLGENSVGQASVDNIFCLIK